jgi:hypothetical protein
MTPNSDASEAAHLSSISSALDELTGRIADVAARYDGTQRADVASDLYDVERALRAATRRLAKVQLSMRGQ